MSAGDVNGKSEMTQDGPKGMRIKSGSSSDEEPLDTIHVHQSRRQHITSTGTEADSKVEIKSTSHSPIDSSSRSSSRSRQKPAREQKVGGEVTVQMEPGQMPKLARSISQTVIAAPPTLFDHLPDMTAVAQSTFQVIPQCIYAAKYLGSTEHAMECDCVQAWGKTSRLLLT